MYQPVPGMPRGCQAQRKGKSEHPACLFQVPADVVDGRVMLPPLLLRVFRRDKREQAGRTITGVFADYLLQERVPADGFLLARYFGYMGSVCRPHPRSWSGLPSAPALVCYPLFYFYLITENADTHTSYVSAGFNGPNISRKSNTFGPSRQMPQSASYASSGSSGTVYKSS